MAIRQLCIILFICYPNVLSALRMIQLLLEANGNYITVYWPDGAVRIDSVPYTHASTFEIHEVPNSNTQWQLRALKNNLFLSAEGGGGTFCVANRSTASGWETFEVTLLPESRVQLRSFSGNWLGVDESNTSILVATASQPSIMETFKIIEVPQHRAVNLGSWLVPEKWMFDSSSELWVNTTTANDLYTLSLELGPDEATRRMKSHWNSWFTEDDFAAMARSGVNHIRIPMGYWDMIQTNPYVFGGAEFVEKAIGWAGKRGITVLIDLHGAPGSQNGNDHSGKSGSILWPQPENVALTVEVLGMIAERWANVANVWGIELLNEPDWSISHDLLTQFYRDGYAAIRKHSSSVHVVINSLYGPHDWTATVLPEPQYRNVVLDLHLYTVWSGFSTVQQYYDEASRWAEEIRSLVPFYPVIVGEMSLATGLSNYTAEQRQTFADKEMASFRDNALGFVFWSYKLGYHSADWSFLDAAPYVREYYSS